MNMRNILVGFEYHQLVWGDIEFYLSLYICVIPKSMTYNEYDWHYTEWPRSMSKDNVLCKIP